MKNRIIFLLLISLVKNLSAQTFIPNDQRIGDTIEFITNFSSKADASNFLVVYPNGRKFLTQTWNAGTCCGNSVTFNVDDVGFIVKMIDSLKANYNIDTTRIYLTGASNGGMMAYRLACERADLFAAVAPVATTMFVTSPCIPSCPYHSSIYHYSRLVEGVVL
jgi:polyhydroxybutyrate depolymerase